MTKSEKEARKNAMIAMRKEKKSLQEIGDAFGLTRERIRQIIGNTGQVIEPRYPPGHRRCYRCKRTLKYGDFYTEKCNVCIECTKERSRELSKTRYKRHYLKGGKYYKQQVCRQKTHKLIESGDIVPTDCIVGMANGFDDCNGRIEAHHYAGYNHPELVEFYCQKHHLEIDGSKWGKT